jgi:regulatory protein
MEITKIEAQARNPGKANIYIDGQFSLALSLSQVSQLKLKVGQQISPEQFAELKAESLFIKYYQKALDYLAKAARSEAQMRDYIINKSSKTQVIKKRSGQIIKLKAELSPDEAEVLAQRIVEHLKAKKFLDDAAFAQFFIKTKLYKNYSFRRLRQELVKKGIKSEIIEDVLFNAAQLKTEQQALAELLAKLKTKTRYQDELKLKRYLVSKGFSYGAVKRAVEEGDY